MWQTHSSPCRSTSRMASRNGCESARKRRALGQFVHAFTDRRAIPSRFAFGAALSSGTEFADGTRHENPPCAAFQGMSGFDEERLQRVREFHGFTSRATLSVYPISGVFFSFRIPNPTESLIRFRL